MTNETLFLIRSVVSACELVLILFLLPFTLSRHPDKNDPDYMLRLVLLLGLVKGAVDFVYGFFPGTFTFAEFACVAGVAELAMNTAWYLFTVSYLWNNWQTTVRSTRFLPIWLVPWLALAAYAMAGGNLQDELAGGAGGKPMYLILCWLTMLPMLFSAALLAGKHENLPARDTVLLVGFILPSAAGVALAYIEPTLLWKSPGLSLALLCAILYLQSRTLKDPLTGAHTRAWFRAKLAERLRDARTSPFMLLMIDLDGFKKINDTWGHLEGDQALITVVELLKKSLRSSDLVARFAGDEFLVLANLASESECEIVMKRIRTQLMQYNLSSGKPYALGWSTGMLYCDRPRNPDELLAAVDEHMYRAKKQGRK